MTRHKKRNRKEKEKNEKTESGASWHADLLPETKKGILAIISFLAAVIFVMSYIGKGGSAGGYIFQVFDFLLGRGYFLAPLMFIMLGFSLLFSEKRKVLAASTLGGILFLLAGLGGLHIMFGGHAGGFLGAIIGLPLMKLFDFWASLIIDAGLFIISLLLMLNLPLWRRKEERDAISGEAEAPDEEEKKEAASDAAAGVKTVLENINATIQSALERKEDTVTSPSGSSANQTGEEAILAVRKIAKHSGYTKPPLELLQGDRGKPSSGDIRANANIIKRTLENFGIDVEMDEVSVGPTVTQYALKPAEGVKLSRIVALHNDLSLALAAHPIRIEAPIPGKSLIGIEVPNRSIALVGLRSLLEHHVAQAQDYPLLFALGRDVTGVPVFADLAKMPHLLISGATGSGKSVSMHSIITSFLYRNPPEVLRFIIVDPKRVELSVYNDIPHLLTPVITDAKATIQSLRWAAKEMDRRYGLLSSHHARDLASYNAKAAQNPAEEFLPYIVIIIDELADIMFAYPREMESSIVRIAQMARAVGIHLVVATQRPSVEVITGLIKANITSRIAFQVASQIDSRTILDTSGAEKLLGNGDMLFISGDSGKPRRIQGAYVAEQEVKRVVDFLREKAEAPEYDEAILEATIEEKGSGDDFIDDSEDPLYGEAKIIVCEAGKASASYLQRRLRIGYARAARLLDILEARGVIGPGEGAKPREILIRTADADPNQTFESR